MVLNLKRMEYVKIFGGFSIKEKQNNKNLVVKKFKNKIKILN